MTRGPLRWALIALGLVSLALGAVGVFLPVLPTTPLLLLAAFCFARTSERLHRYLMNHRLFGRYLREYREGRMSRAYKARTLALMWAGMLLSMWLIGEWWAVGVLGFIAVAVTVHIWRLRPSADVAEAAGLTRAADTARPTS